MAGATIPRAPSERGVDRFAFSRIHGFTNRLQALIDLLVAEMAPRHRRVRTAVRMAFIASFGAGVMAACHVESILGPYIVWSLVSGAGPMMNFAEATGFTIAAAVMVGLSFLLAGIFAETPWLMVPFVGVLIAALTYSMPSSKFGSPGLVLKVITLDTFYDIVFRPADFGYGIAATFGGAALAFAIIALFDTWLWPNPAETILLESVAESLERIRRRLLALGDSYLDPGGRIKPPSVPPISAMPTQLELLKRTASEGVSAYRHAILLSSITRTERLHNEVDRMTIVALEDAPREVRGILRRELSDAIAAVAAALDELARLMPHEIPVGPDLPPPPAATHIKPVMNALDTATLAARPGYISRVPAGEVVNLAAFIAGLTRMAELLDRRLDQPPASELSAARAGGWFELPPYNPAMIRYSIKLGLATMLGYVIGVASHHSELNTILTTVIITGLPTYGAAVHKMILRLVGSAIGGMVALLTITLITPNFETLPVYVLAFFLVSFVSAYAGGSSGRIAYAGSQIGTAFVLTFAGLSPSEAIDTPLYRVWSILLGVMIVAVVFFSIWPEYSSDSMLPRLRKALRDTLDLVPGTAVAASEASIDATSSEISQTLFELLGVVDDARLEGARSRIDPAAVVDACGTLRRIAHRLGRLDAERLEHPLPPLAPASAALYETFLAAFRARGARWLNFLLGPDALNSPRAAAVAASFTHDELTRPLQELNDRISADQFAEVGQWTLEQRRGLLAELQSFHRITELAAELDGHMAHVPRLALAA